MSVLWNVVAENYKNLQAFFAMQVFNSRLYIPTTAKAPLHETGLLLRLNEAKNALEQICGQYDEEDIVEYYSCAIVFDGRLYAGSDSAGYLMRLNELGNAWEKVAPQYNIEEVWYEQLSTLGVFENELYAGSHFKGCLLRWNPNTLNWGFLGGLWPTIEFSYFYGLCVYNNRLYFVTSDSGLLVRLNEAKNGLEIVADKYENMAWLMYTVVFKGYLYATGASDSGPAVLLRFNDEVGSWEGVASYGDCDQFSSLVVYNNSLYVATYSDNELLKLNEENNTLELVCYGEIALPARIAATAVFDGVLYAATDNGGLYSYNDNTGPDPDPDPVSGYGKLIVAVPGENGLADIDFTATNVLYNNIWMSLMTRKGSRFDDLEFGSRLHELKLRGGKLTAGALVDAKMWAEQALQWLVTVGRAKSIEVSVVQNAEIITRVDFSITVLSAINNSVTYSIWYDVI